MCQWRHELFYLVLLNVVNTLRDEHVLELHMHLKGGGGPAQIIAKGFFPLPFFFEEVENSIILQSRPKQTLYDLLPISF